MRLKAELQRRENNDPQDDANVNVSRGAPGHDNLSSDKHLKNSSASRHRRPGQKSNPLPPISPSKGHAKGSGYHRKGGPLRSKGQPPAPHATVGRIVNSAGVRTRLFHIIFNEFSLECFCWCLLMFVTKGCIFRVSFFL